MSGPSKRSHTQFDLKTEDVSNILKTVLQAEHLGRLAYGLLHLGATCPTDSAVAQDMTSGGKYYHELTKGKSKHQEGGPELYKGASLVRGLYQDLQDINYKPSAADEKGKRALELLKVLYDRFQSAQSPQDLTDVFLSARSKNATSGFDPNECTLASPGRVQESLLSDGLPHEARLELENSVVVASESITCPRMPETVVQNSGKGSHERGGLIWTVDPTVSSHFKPQVQKAPITISFRDLVRVCCPNPSDLRARSVHEGPRRPLSTAEDRLETAGDRHTYGPSGSQRPRSQGCAPLVPRPQLAEAPRRSHDDKIEHSRKVPSRPFSKDRPLRELLRGCGVSIPRR